MYQDYFSNVLEADYCCVECFPVLNCKKLVLIIVNEASMFF